MSAYNVMNSDCEPDLDVNYSLKIKTVQSSAFRILIEALKEILVDANLECDETGIKMIAMDSSHTVLAHLKLFSDKFEFYQCLEKRVLGINMINFFRFF